jgi:hypothetical protein
VLESAALPKAYKGHLEQLSLVILVVDPMLKRESVLYVAPLSDLPETMVLDPKRLKGTSCRTEMPLELNICATGLNGSAAWPRRRASRLASWRLTLVNHSKGPRFPWVRRTAADFKAAGLPSNATFFVSLSGVEPEDLLTDGEADIEDALEVWIHEDAWVVLQQSDANPGVAALQRLLVAQVASQILELGSAPLKKNVQVVDGSIFDRLAGHIASAVKIDYEEFKKALRSRTVAEVAPFACAAFGLNKAMSTILERQ